MRLQERLDKCDRCSMFENTGMETDRNIGAVVVSLDSRHILFISFDFYCILVLGMYVGIYTMK